MIAADVSQKDCREQAQETRNKAESAQTSQEREKLLKKARQLDVAAHANEWASSPGLQTPEA